MDTAIVTSWLADWADRWSVPELAHNVTVEPSTRLRRSLGRCLPRSGTIRIHAALFEGPRELLQEVVCHEAAHAATWLMHGMKAKPHGPEWRRLMDAAGYRPRVTMDPDLLPESLRPKFAPKALYRHRCPVCGANRIARRVVRRWRCRACHRNGLHGRLEITITERGYG